ncbi:MAG: hypothetical protein GY827_11945 [Cytophagales bacterium]|nr:hypothetical protein [Cytophagales bacterium]
MTKEQIDFLNQNDYPADFIEWHQNNNDSNITSLEQVIEESHNYYDLLIPNGYLVLAIDGGGNCYAYEKESKSIKFVDHIEAPARYDALEELYSEVYEFWDNEDGTYHNPENLDIKEIFEENSDNLYKKDSIYIKEGLQEGIEDTEFETFSDLVIKLKS